MKNLEFKAKLLNLALFDNTNVTTDAGMTAEQKVFWDTDLIENAKPYLVHDQFGQTRDIPKGNGKTIEFRRSNPLGKALTPLQEGVTPSGQSLSISSFTATVKQYGGYIETSDLVDLTSCDKVLLEGNKLIGQQAGETLDTITREAINAGTSVLYSQDTKTAATPTVCNDRSEIDDKCPLSVLDIKKAERFLKVMKAQKINGSYVAIIHPDQSFNLKTDPEWIDAHKYVTPENIYEGEIGKISGVRFVETTEAKIFCGDNLTAAARNLTVATKSGNVITVDEAITAAEAAALTGRPIIIASKLYTIVSVAAGAASAATITVKETPDTGVTDGATIYPGEGGKAGASVYSTLVLGANAYGTTKVEGGGLQMIAKPLGSAGSADALNQRATQGWKAIKTAEILTEGFLIRIESGSEFNSPAN